MRRRRWKIFRNWHQEELAISGRKAWEFVGILSDSEPQSRIIDSGVAPAAIEDSFRYIAAALKFDERTVGIPDFAALAKVLYPGR